MKLFKHNLAKIGLCLLVFPCVFSEAFAINNYELAVIRKGIESSFKLLISAWSEESYFEMYDLGQEKSRTRLTKSEFAQRMVELKWKPSLKPIEIKEIKIIYRNFAAIYFIQQFENKVNSLELVEKEMIFPAILEKNSWKYDLTQLINIPYEGAFVDRTEEKKPVKAEEPGKPAAAIPPATNSPSTSATPPAGVPPKTEEPPK